MSAQSPSLNPTSNIATAETQPGAWATCGLPLTRACGRVGFRVMRGVADWLPGFRGIVQRQAAGPFLNSALAKMVT